MARQLFPHALDNRPGQDIGRSTFDPNRRNHLESGELQASTPERGCTHDSTIGLRDLMILLDDSLDPGGFSGTT